MSNHECPADISGDPSDCRYVPGSVCECDENDPCCQPECQLKRAAEAMHMLDRFNRSTTYTDFVRGF
jgi:hypothetical protein